MEPATLIQLLDTAVPGFADYVRSDDNLFDYDNSCGIFLACSTFVGNQPVSAASWRQVAELVNSIVAGTDAELSNSVCGCFLENLADKKHPLRPLLGPEALKFWEYWEPK